MFYKMIWWEETLYAMNLLLNTWDTKLSQCLHVTRLTISPDFVNSGGVVWNKGHM